MRLKMFKLQQAQSECAQIVQSYQPDTKPQHSVAKENVPKMHVQQPALNHEKQPLNPSNDENIRSLGQQQAVQTQQPKLKSREKSESALASAGRNILQKQEDQLK
jgi:hypothetical protein